MHLDNVIFLGESVVGGKLNSLFNYLWSVTLECSSFRSVFSLNRSYYYYFILFLAGAKCWRFCKYLNVSFLTFSLFLTQKFKIGQDVFSSLRRTDSLMTPELRRKFFLHNWSLVGLHRTSLEWLTFGFFPLIRRLLSR